MDTQKALNEIGIEFDMDPVLNELNKTITKKKFHTSIMSGVNIVAVPNVLNGAKAAIHRKNTVILDAANIVMETLGGKKKNDIVADIISKTGVSTTEARLLFKESKNSITEKRMKHKKKVA